MHGFALQWLAIAETLDIVLSAMNVDCIASQIGSLFCCINLGKGSRSCYSSALHWFSPSRRNSPERFLFQKYVQGHNLELEYKNNIKQCEQGPRVWIQCVLAVSNGGGRDKEVGVANRHNQFASTIVLENNMMETWQNVFNLWNLMIRFSDSEIESENKDLAYNLAENSRLLC
jgi:hypothetical protein